MKIWRHSKREPLWVTALTWTGSGLVVLGITIMFYGRSLSKKLQQKSPENLITDSETTITETRESQQSTVTNKILGLN